MATLRRGGGHGGQGGIAGARVSRQRSRHPASADPFDHYILLFGHRQSHNAITNGRGRIIDSPISSRHFNERHRRSSGLGRVQDDALGFVVGVALGRCLNIQRELPAMGHSRNGSLLHRHISTVVETLSRMMTIHSCPLGNHRKWIDDFAGVGVLKGLQEDHASDRISTIGGGHEDGQTD